MAPPVIVPPAAVVPPLLKPTLRLHQRAERPRPRRADRVVTPTVSADEAPAIPPRPEAPVRTARPAVSPQITPASAPEWPWTVALMALFGGAIGYGGWRRVAHRPVAAPNVLVPASDRSVSSYTERTRVRETEPA